MSNSGDSRNARVWLTNSGRLPTKTGETGKRCRNIEKPSRRCFTGQRLLTLPGRLSNPTANAMQGLRSSKQSAKPFAHALLTDSRPEKRSINPWDQPSGLWRRTDHSQEISLATSALRETVAFLGKADSGFS